MSTENPGMVKETQVSKAVVDLSSGIEGLKCKVNELEERLNSCLKHPIPEKEKEKEKEINEITLVPLAEEIKSFSCKIDKAYKHLDDIISRIEL